MCRGGFELYEVIGAERSQQAMCITVVRSLFIYIL